MSWRHFAPWKDKFGLCTCWLTLIKFECSSLNDVKFASSVSWTATDSQTEVLALKMLDIFHCCFSDCELKREVELALISSPRFLEAIWLLNSDWLGDSILNGDWLYFHMWRMLYAKLIGRIAFIHMWKYSTYRILFARFIAQNSRYVYKKTIYHNCCFPVTTTDTEHQKGPTYYFSFGRGLRQLTNWHFQGNFLVANKFITFSFC